jgi:antitoxin HicB
MPIGSNFDDFLKEEGIFETTTAGALKKVLAVQIEEEMHAQKLTKTAMAQRMHTSRAALNRLLDDKDTSFDADNAGKRCCGAGEVGEVGVSGCLSKLNLCRIYARL